VDVGRRAIRDGFGERALLIPIATRAASDIIIAKDTRPEVDPRNASSLEKFALSDR
jgi:hypothetical protein